MVKTGKIAAFALGEKKTAMINLPAHFVTANTANENGWQYSELVDYSLKDQNGKAKTSEANNGTIEDAVTLSEQFEGSRNHGYATRSNAVTENQPVFSHDKLNYNNHDISNLKKRLDEAQQNGNNIYELAFSIRGDWLVKNKLYDPETKVLNQNKLKRAEQDVAKKLINQGFSLPLGETPEDVAWFGVIHQDTDHLNMHLWFAKVSPETRLEMLKQTGPYKGQQVGVIPLKNIEKAKRQFRNQLMSESEVNRRQEILKGVASCKDEIIASTDQHLSSEQYAKQIKQIYQALPQEMNGKWQVGNTTLTSGRGRMTRANLLTNDLIDDVLKNQLGNTYQSFMSFAKQYDDINIEDQGMRRKEQRNWSENKEAELKKRLANQLYRHLNGIEKSDTVEKQLAPIFERIKAQTDQKGINGSQWRSEDLKGIDTQRYSINDIPALNRQPEPHILKNNRTINKISRLWQQDVRAEVNAEKRFIAHQRREAVERQREDYENQVSRGR
ncbi:MobP2 family relaxase [Leuconostoc lactis]|uniref:MobP2 family relaxase n=1 Tax=Leuconostoc lactis TaxID=1246 RepID=UPI000814FB8A|nr:MobP2 family relaxase [Leuconostoc lactis]ANY10945.1 transposase [Leuconostoc lactis]